MRAPILSLALLCACTIDDRVLSTTSTPVLPAGVAGASALGGGASTATGGGSANLGEAPAGANIPLLPGSVLTVDVNAIDFGRGVGGQTLTRTIRVRNAGDTQARDLGVTLDGEQNESFGIGVGGCGATLGPGAECRVNVTFTPDGIGPRSATVVVSLGNAQELRVALSGAGVSAGSLAAEVAQVDFETQEAGVRSAGRQWAVTNTGATATGPLTLTNGAPMTFETTTDCGAPLPPGGSCTVSAQFIGARREVSHASVIVTDGANTALTELSVVALPRLTIVTIGVGQVQLTQEPQIPCYDGCSFLMDSSVTLVATPTGASSSFFTGWSSSNVADPSCSGLVRECRAFPEISETMTAHFGELANNLIFVSSEAFPANLGGTAPYDSACNRLASAAGINVASGTGYIAVLSGPSSFVERVPASARGWVRMDGLPVADALAGLLDNGPAPFYPVSLTELGRVSLDTTWTGTQADGSAIDTCGDWTSSSPDDRGLQGRPSSVAWLDRGQQLCNRPYAVYCMGVTKTAPVALQPVTGKRLWVTPTLLTVGSQSPDAFCQASRPAGVANAAALLGNTTRAGGDVLDPTANYVRPDGALIGTGSELRAGQLTTAIRFDSGGSALTTSDQIWTGGLLSQLPTVTSNCNDWTDPAGTGTFGIPTETDFRAFSLGLMAACSTPMHLYCVEL